MREIKHQETAFCVYNSIV